MLDFLASLRLFRDLKESELRLLVSTVELVDLATGAVLFHEGDPGDAAYIVHSGTLQVAVGLPSGHEHPLDLLGSGDLVGEMAVLYRRPRAATVRALTSCTLLKIHDSTIEQMSATNPSVRTRLLEVASWRLPSLYLASVPMFAGLSAEALRDLDLHSNWIQLAGGTTLFRKGDQPDYLYVVVRGRLEVVSEIDDGHPSVIGHLGRGDVVGEVALLTGVPRSATVRAIRDSELVRLSKSGLYKLLEHHPRGAMEIVRILAGRMPTVAPASRDTPVSTIAVVPTGRAPLPPGWTARLVEMLAGIGGPTLHVNRHRIDEEFGDPASSSDHDEASHERIASWLHEQEDRFPFIVFDCESLPPLWTSRCLRQADLVLFVAPPGAQPSSGDLERRIFSGEAVAPSTSKELVLLHREETPRPTGTSRWLSAFPVARHHHVRVDRAEDYARLARYTAGKAIGLALSGGGARTFAHLGVMYAMRERGVPIDAVAGVSAGAFAAAFCALGHDLDAIRRLSHEHMGEYSLASDATLPMAAFMSGKKLVRMLQRLFGDIDIEDLWLPFFCLSANLTTARVVVHDRGPLWLGIRATTSVPGIEPPVCVDGELLVDGGLLNNLPVDVVRKHCNGVVVASDVSLTVDLAANARELSAASGWPLLWARLNPFAKAKPKLPHIFEILTRTATLGSIHHGASAAKAADLCIRTPTDDVPTFDWQAGTVLVDRAYQLALHEIEHWQAREFPNG